MMCALYSVLTRNESTIELKQASDVKHDTDAFLISGQLSILQTSKIFSLDDANVPFRNIIFDKGLTNIFPGSCRIICVPLYSYIVTRVYIKKSF